MGTFFRNNWFEILEKAGAKLEFDYVALMMINNCEFEYWIGMMFEGDAVIPSGFDCLLIPNTKYAVCWLYGNETSGELFGLDTHNKCIAALNEKRLIRKEGSYCIERYNCPRYTSPDEKGNVILDYYIAIE